MIFQAKDKTKKNSLSYSPNKSKQIQAKSNSRGVSQQTANQGESLLPDITNFGKGTVENRTSKTFQANASAGKSGAQIPVKIPPGKWGGDNPIGNLNDIDFVFPTKETPINSTTNGAFKIGSNDATIFEDSSNSANSKIDDFTGYWSDKKAKSQPGYPNHTNKANTK